jgi:hypothetical protein
VVNVFDHSVTRHTAYWGLFGLTAPSTGIGSIPIRMTREKRRDVDSITSDSEGDSITKGITSLSDNGVVPIEIVKVFLSVLTPYLRKCTNS